MSLDPGSDDVVLKNAVKGGGIVAGVAVVLSVVLHAVLVPPVLKRIETSVVISEPPPQKRVEVVLKPPKIVSPKKGKVPKPKGVHRRPHPQVVLRPATNKPLPGTFFTSIRRPQPPTNQPPPKNYAPEPIEEPTPEPPIGEKVAIAALTPTPAPPPVRPPAPPPPPPRPVGPTTDPEPTYAPKPRIPRAVLAEKGENDVRVRFVIAGDGSASVTLVTSSGIAALDASALDTCRTWRWKAALRDGVPYTRVVNERIEFVVI